MSDRIERVRQALAMRDADYNVRPEIEDIGNLLHQYDRLRAELAEAKARIAALSTVLNRLANGTRFTSDETLRVIHKVTTEILGEAYEPFDVKMP